MKRRQRQRQILELLQADPELAVDAACARLGASAATIRREFAQLAAEGRVDKTWGGIRLKASSPPPAGPAAFHQRLAENATEKRALAEAAAALLEDGDVAMIDGGTTTYQLCEFIALKRIRIITNSLVIAQAVDRLKGRQRGAEIYLTGGILQPESSVLSGPPAEAFLKRYHARWAFLSAAGVDAKEATNHNEAVLASERLMIEQSERVALLVDHTKLGQRAMCAICPLTKVDHLFTGDTPESRKVARAHSGSKLQIHLADFPAATPVGR
ncbi:MAG: DeoR/GlpR family DNA-binding transcription regulator [Chthoniobacter sp.]